MPARGENMKNNGIRTQGHRPLDGPKLCQAVLLGAYGAALLICLVCDLATGGGLSWFYIVLCSLLLAFSLLNLPFLLKRHRLVFPALAATLSLFLLLAACEAVTGGGWLRPYGVPIAAFPLTFAWAMLLVTQLKRLNWFFRSALLSLLAGVLALTMDAWVGAVLAGETDHFAQVLAAGLGRAGSLGGILAAACFFLYFAVGAVLGVLSAAKRARGEEKR